MARVWILGKKPIDGVAPGTPVAVEKPVADRLISAGVAEECSPPESVESAPSKVEKPPAKTSGGPK